MNKKHIKEEGLRDWFGKSKSKGGKKGWVNVVTGDSCASDKPGEGIPKCVSSSKRASMSKKERVAAQAAKRREDPGQQKKSGASKPTMVKTDRKVRKEEKFVPPYEELKTVAREKEKKKSRMKAMEVNGALDEAKDKKGKGSGSKDACYHKVKSRYSVWPSAYASGALVKCRKVGAANWGNKSEETEFDSISFQQFQEKCWKGYEKKGMKTMFGKRYPNCVKKKVGESMVNWREDLDIEEGAAWTKKSGKSASGGLNEKGRKSYERDNPGSDLKAPSKKVGNPRRKSFCARMKGMKKKLTSAKTARDPDSRINKSLRAWNC